MELTTTARAETAVLTRTHARRFAFLTWLAIGVSYVHQAGSLLLFSGDGWPDVAATLGMIAIVDLSLWMLGEYLYEASRAGRRPTAARLTFWLATAVSIGLNFVYLYSHRPATLDTYLSTTIAAIFGLFVPLLIAVSGRIRADLARWERETAADTITAAQATAEARQLRGRVAALEQDIAEQRRVFTDAAQAGTEQTRRLTEAERQATELRARATAAEKAATEWRERATAAERQATALPTRQAVAARLKQELERMSAAELARATGWRESTLRDMVAAA